MAVRWVRVAVGVAVAWGLLPGVAGAQRPKGKGAARVEKRGPAPQGGRATPAEAQRSTVVDARTGIEWVRVPGGAFTMGSPADEADRDEDEVQRAVTLPAFELSRTEVTVAQYARCVTAGACTAPETSPATCNWDQEGRSQHPVNCVSWAQARAYAVWAGGRLPSEAEWEYAARAGSKGPVYDAPGAPRPGRPPETRLADVAVFRENSGVTYEGEDCVGWARSHAQARCGSHPVGTRRGNALGLHDMLGNVLEWVEDTYGPYGEAPADGRPQTKPGETRVQRGGFWATKASMVRLARRDEGRPEEQLMSSGVRVARAVRAP